MCWRIHISLLVVLVQVFGIAAFTNTDDFVALKSLKDVWNNVPPNWDGADPCGSDWDGISCSNSRVVSITLASFNLSGQLSSDIEGLSELQTLDLSYNKGMTGALPSAIGNLKKLSSLILVGCGFSGPIPPSIGSLQQLVYLSLNSNNFVGEIPPSIGSLSNLYWLDLADNKLSGTIPVSNGSTPGLDMLINTKHFHFGRNQLSGEIPSQLFSSNLTLIHLLLENNQLTGSIPSSLGFVQTLEVVRLDRNSLTGPVPRNLNSLTSVHELDVSNNSFDATDVPPWFSSLQSLTSLIMENTRIQGQLPVSLFSLSQLQTVALKNNRINGTLNIGSSHSSQLQLIDLQNNFIDAFTQRADLSEIQYVTKEERIITAPFLTSLIPHTQHQQKIAQLFLVVQIKCLVQHANKLMTTFKSHGQPVDSVSLSNPTKNVDRYLELNLQVFPSGQDYFNRTGISGIGFMMSNQTFKPPPGFGPFYFIANTYPNFPGLTEGSHKSSNTGVIIGAAVGGSVLFLLLLLAGVYAFRQKRRAETATKKSDPFASWDRTANSGGVPEIKGAKSFSFEEIRRCTNNFSEMNEIGIGGYGKVYRGTLPNGKLVAIKRSQKGSNQGGLEFKTEIELLSRVHHRNVVSLVGFCFDHGEQMLVYEYITNGSLKDSLTGRSGIRLDWTRRLRIALGAARGVQYLHDQANPPIIHRDIKSNNILLDEKMNAKVADFGLSKPMGEPERGHVTTQVKGTMGYLDPEYYMTQELTEKSDVYSFGVLLFELLTSRSPIVKGKYIVREVKQAMDKTKELYNLEDILDPIVASNMAPRSVEKLVDLALRCVQELGANRPTMSDVVKEIENVMEFAGLNPNTSASTSESYEGVKKEFDHPYTNESLFAYSGAFSPTRKLEESDVKGRQICTIVVEVFV
ncbi:hypothetical protein DH2020_044987 [Rehmannia glutinosa]|uniref:Protein kinase domain-containing protein n=1 Tax=Rehmannia glutinosa TaxID=99300 RepID=A0ABR0UFG4_REHGL